jgi:hypothetical protein
MTATHEFLFSLLPAGFRKSLFRLTFLESLLPASRQSQAKVCMRGVEAVLNAFLTSELK